jgi:hypothetical protein
MLRSSPYSYPTSIQEGDAAISLENGPLLEPLFKGDPDSLPQAQESWKGSVPVSSDISSRHVWKRNFGISPTS